MNYHSLALTTALILSSCATQGQLPIVTIRADESTLPESLDKPTNLDSTLTLQQISKRVRDNNPQLKAARYRIAEAKGNVIQSGRLTNPELGIDLNKNVRSSEGGMELSFAQRFPITNRLSIEKRISQHQLDIAKEEVKSAENSFAAQAQETAIELLHNRQRAQLLHKQMTLLNALAEFIEEGSQKGEFSALDANQAKVESATLQAQLSSLNSKETLLLNTLKGYIGLNTQQALDLQGQLPAAIAPAAALHLENRPEMRAKALEIRAAQQQLALQKALRYDDVEGKVFTQIDRSIDEPAGLETEGTIGAGISIPLPLHNKNTGNIHSAEARIQRLLSEKAALRLEIQQQAANAKAEMDIWLKQITHLADTLIPLAADNAQQLEQAYRNGLAPFTSVLKAHSQQLDLHNQRLDQLESFHKARARYLSAIGSASSTF